MGGPTTVFVRNLPYTCTDAGLEEAFSEIGPVKECFIIADKGAGGRSKGFGFVHFALAEDAAAAVAKSRSFQIDGRAVTIDIAKQKPSAAGATAGAGKKKSSSDGGGGSGGGGGGGGSSDYDDDDGGGDNDSDSDAPKARSAPPPRQQQQQQQHQQKRGGGGAPSAAAAAAAAALAMHPALKDADKAARTVAMGGLRLAGEPDGIDPEAALDAARVARTPTQPPLPPPHTQLKLAAAFTRRHCFKAPLTHTNV